MPLSAYATTGPRFDLDPASALKLDLARVKNTYRVIEQWADATLDCAIRF